MRTLARRFLKLLLALGVLLLLLMGAALGALWLTLPNTHQQARIPGLAAPVDIGFDAYGIPRIRADNELDAATALGFVHARDRMFQMDLMRRAASGRLSEIAGAATLPMDRGMRVFGLRHLATADYAALPDDTRAVLDAYARGVNAWIDLKGRFSGLEFLLLGAPEPWHPSDSLLWAKTMGLWLSMNWRTELSRMALAGKVEQRLIDELWPNGGTGPRAAANPLARFADAAAGVSARLPRFPSAFTQPPSASNEWAVDGRHTVSGAPLLAGDPHLAFGYPGIWYLARIETPARTLVGATGPGVPFLVIGHNERIAWTFTTTGADVQDIFIEDPSGPFTSREERIAVRGQPDEVLTVRSTRHGPVISDLYPTKDGAVLAVAMGNLQPNDTAATGLLALNRAETVATAGRAAAAISSPVQNLLVADRDRIGVFVTGRIPIRKSGDGSAPVPGDGSYDWIGWAEADALPNTIAPSSGRLVNANERIASAAFPVFLGRDWYGDWRARRVHALLDATPKADVAAFARMQMDDRSAFAEQVLPVLRALTGTGGLAARAQSLLRDWDGTMAMDLPQPLIFNRWIERFYRMVLAKAGIPVEHGGPVADFVAFVLSPGGAHWCDGDCSTVLRDSLIAAMTDLEQAFGPDPAAWRWGTAHVATFAHPILRGLPVLGAWSTAAIPSSGDDTTLNRGGGNGRGQSVHGAGYRGVYDLADLERSRFMVAPGQSGHLLSRHARDFLTRWRDGDTIAIERLTGPPAAGIRLEPKP